MLNYYETRCVVIMGGKVLSDKTNRIIEEETTLEGKEVKTIRWNELAKIYKENHDDFSFCVFKPHLWWRISSDNFPFISELENINANFTVIKTTKRIIPTLNEILNSSDKNAKAFLLEHGNIELR